MLYLRKCESYNSSVKLPNNAALESHRKLTIARLRSHWLENYQWWYSRVILTRKSLTCITILGSYCLEKFLLHNSRVILTTKCLWERFGVIINRKLPISRLDSRVVIYDRRVFIILVTALDWWQFVSQWLGVADILSTTIRQQSDQRLKQKVAQIFQKLTQKWLQQFLLQKDVCQNSPKSHKIFMQLL